jgi:hypothetical protein
MAGALGFEPRYAGIKTLCRTAWRRPKAIAILPILALVVNYPYFDLPENY